LLLRPRTSEQYAAEDRRLMDEKLAALSPEDRTIVDEVRRLTREGGFTTEERDEIFAQARVRTQRLRQR
jgi:hypothetical protein